MGWHLKDGEYLINNHFQVARQDIFSYTMPDFPLIMHEWVSDIIMFVIYWKLGFLALSIFFALIILAAYIFASFGVSAKKEYKIIAAILAIIASIPVLGVRPQMINLLFLAILIFVIFKFRQNNHSRLIYCLPLIFFLWVNFHGGFFVGLFFIGIFLGIEIIKQLFLKIAGRIKAGKFYSKLQEINVDSVGTRPLKKLAVIFSLSATATLLNPYGWRIYIEVLTTIFDSYTKSNVREWLPVTASNPMSYQFITYTALLVILLLFSYKKIDYTYLFISAVFFYIAITSWRHMPLFLLVSTPLWVNITEAVSGAELQKIIKSKIFLSLMVVVVFFIAKQQLKSVVPGNVSVEKLSEAGGYPYGAVKYLKNNPIEGNMFNEYNWGGYLDWQYPEKKVFIDGRMPSWRIGEFRVFKDFNTISDAGAGWEELLEKYDIRFSLVYNNEINRAKYEFLKWKMAYSDNLAVIYVRPD